LAWHPSGPKPHDKARRAQVARHCALPLERDARAVHSASPANTIAAPAAQVDVLLATYNGAAYLPELLRSISDQDFTGWRLVVGDDHSSDATGEILAALAAEDPQRLRVLPSGEERFGARGNFGRLCEASTAPYAMFCDQDDVWLPGKIALTLARMRELEAESGAETPILVHTDLSVVDARLGPISSSLWRYQRLDPRLTSPRHIAVQNHITGCAVMVNRALLKLALPIPPEAIMHDWWLALVASVHGRISAIDRPTILYRQHGGNSLGAKRWGLRLIVDRALRARDSRDALRAVQAQASAFLERYRGSLDQRQLRLFSDLASLGGRGWLTRRWLVARHGAWKAGLTRNLGMLIRL
jgi:glycosyltransferase involved in cell wall biosynthesis